ncbi:MAG: hypothetical protein AAF502_21345 [Bacteroidota bacterium]
MKHIKFVIPVLILFMSCQKDGVLPECIAEITDDDSTLQIETQEVNNEIHYRLNDGFANGVEYIINSECDTVCYLPFGLVFIPCLQDYRDPWEPLWP